MKRMRRIRWWDRRPWRVVTWLRAVRHFLVLVNISWVSLADIKSMQYYASPSQAQAALQAAGAGALEADYQAARRLKEQVVGVLGR